jgi:uncharacterized membrane protein YgcG
MERVPGVSARPRARRDGLEIEELADETIVYDEVATRVHCLNRSASLVWRYCDGDTEVVAMAGRLGADLGEPVDDTVVLFALRQLAERDLLEAADDVPRGSVTSRRQLLKGMGFAAAVAVPLVTSLSAPAAAAAASGTTSSSGGSSSGGSSGVSSGGSSGGSSGSS